MSAQFNAINKEVASSGRLNRSLYWFTGILV